MIESAADSAASNFVDTTHGRMRDLELSRRIDAGLVSADDLAPLAVTPLGSRGAFLARLVTLTEHADGEVRTAALACLAGARGMRAVRAIVARLDDDDASVRAIVGNTTPHSARNLAAMLWLSRSALIPQGVTAATSPEASP